MYDRISLTADTRELAELFQVDKILLGCHAGDSLKPTQPITVVVSERGELCLDQYTWGVFPFWARDSINARSETVHEKPAYRRIFTKQRCIVPCDGFYVRKAAGKKERYIRVMLSDRTVFGLAALYDVWKSPGGSEYRTCTILTTAANGFLAPFHERMPVVLDGEAAHVWLNDKIRDAERLIPLLRPYPSERMSLMPLDAEESERRLLAKVEPQGN